MDFRDTIKSIEHDPTKSFLGVASDKFLGFVVTSKGIHLDPEKSALSRRCNLQKVLESLEDCKGDYHIFEGLSQISQGDANLHQIDEEGCFIHLGRCLPTTVRGNQAVPHASTYPYSSSVRKTFSDICSSYDHSLGALLT